MSAESVEIDPNIEGETASPPPSRLRKVLFACLKLGIVFGILFYLVNSRSLEFHKFATVLHGWHWIAIGFLTLIPIYLFSAWRYQLLLGALGINCSFNQSLSLTMISFFYEIVTFSGGGDLVKGWYVVKLAGKGKRGLALISIVVDRVIGLFSLALMALLVCVFAGGTLVDNPELLRLSELLLAASVVCVIGFMVFSSETLEESPLRKRLMHLLPAHEKIENIYTGFSGLRHHKGTLLTILGIAVLAHFLGCIGIVIMGKSLVFTSTITKQPVPLETLPTLVVLPLAIFLNIFGIAGGFGAGELAFEKLFSIMLKVNGGAALAFVFHVVALLSRILCIPYVLQYKHDTLQQSSEAPAAAGAIGN